MPTNPPTFLSVPPVPAPSGRVARYLLHPGQATSRLLHEAAHLLVSFGLHVGLPLLAVTVLAASALALYRRGEAEHLARGARLVRVLSPPEVDPSGPETLWTNLVALLRPAWRRLLGSQPHLGFELTASAGGLDVAMWVPGAVPPGLVERAVEAAWPGARTETVPAEPPLPLGLPATGGTLRLAFPEHYPLRSDHPADPLRSLLGALGGLSEAESACIQVLARPLTGRRLARSHKAAAYRQAGRPQSRVGRLLDLVSPGPVHRPATGDPSRQDDVRAVLKKAAQPAWAVTVRYGVATTDCDRAVEARLRGRAHALASAFALYAGRNRFDRHRLYVPARVLAARRLGRGDLLSVPGRAAIAHLPTDVAVPGLRRAGAKSVVPPPEVHAQGKVLGDAEAGARRPVAVSVADARHHLHVMGATGSGKSTLLTRLALDDVEAGRGVVVVDPKGDLVADLLDRFPLERAGRLVVIDPEGPGPQPGMNLLDGADADLAVDNLVGIFRRIFEAYWGPRTDDVLRAACLTLLRASAHHKAATSLADVPRLLSDPGFRKPFVEVVRADQVGLGGFWSWYEEMTEAQRSQVVGPVMNKLRALLLRDFVRQLVGRPLPSFSMAGVLDGGCCLVRIPKGVLGEETARLLGSFVVAKVWQAATHRARLAQAARADAAIYVDECQNFLNLPRSFDEMLAEARGYRLSMVLAHQHLGQLPRELREAVSANARSKVFFATSPEDARALARHVSPQLSEHDLSHLGAYQAAARLVVDGEETAAFTLRARPAPPALRGRAEAVREAVAARLRAEAAHQGGPSLAGRSLPERASPRGGHGPQGLRGGLREGLRGGLRLKSEPLPQAKGAGRGGGEGSGAQADWVGER